MAHFPTSNQTAKTVGMAQSETSVDNVLAPEAILSIIDKNIKSPEEGEGSITVLGSSQDALAALFHSIMQAVEAERKITRDSEGNIIKLPKEWNEQGPNSYAFRYKHPQSSLTFLIKCMRLSNKFIIHGMGIEDNKTTTLEIITDDYTSPSFFPYTSEKYHVDPMIHGYISTSRVKDLINLYKINIVQKLIPGLNKPGYEETGTTSATTSTPRQQEPYNDPLRIPTRQPPRFQPPNFDEPYGGDEPLRSSFNPFNVGQDDLDPLGVNPIYGPPRFGGGGFQPLGGGVGGGMYAGPDHPIFGQRVPPGGRGGPQPIPRGSVPPGARFDPIVPFGPGSSRPGRPRGDPFSGEPDNDELPPPGYNDMFM
ncbi:15298_t:CDS:2 [Funneliformis geosporum]|uniref:12500_t:CDS:1 n=1 Tax=Funneliformis geosporum TaxID=1117311 RepID=A0A9W4ST31_9GLOM|nr:15298_t:CDS:2 [Funneliformis geosporum]CAI2180596.1 12500_t:CDS:2 [Funneliformis geosporum]